MRRRTKPHFWDNVLQVGSCWEWQGTRRPDGYGLLYVNGVQTRAHRHAFELAWGTPIPPGMSVLHRCDNPPCVRPGHLWLGTDADNLADMRAKGRARHFVGRVQAGEANHNAKLTDDAVREIRRLRATGLLQREIAERLGVHTGTVGYVLRGATWNKVD